MPGRHARRHRHLRPLVPFAAAIVLSVVSVLVGSRTADAAEPFRLYVAPDGLSSNDGLTPQTPVASLESAEYRLRQHDVDTDVEIRIAPGTYTLGQTTWSTYIDGHTISFMPADYAYGNSLPASGRPVFRSDRSGGYWLWAKLPSGHPGGDIGLRFYYLRVMGYSQGGLAIIGPTEMDADRRVGAGTGMNGNVVFGMRFDYIGTKYNSATVGYGGLVMWNSSHNSIRNNHFTYNINIGEDDNLIHGVYLSHESTNNLVEANAFRYITGHPVNVRNDSNRNVVRDNVFERAGHSGGGYFSDWSCGDWCVSKYPGHPRECPSHGNEFVYNELLGSYDGGYEAGFIRQPGDASYIGGPGCSSDGEAWLRTAGNVRP